MTTGGASGRSFCGAEPALESTMDGATTIKEAARLKKIASFVVGTLSLCICSIQDLEFCDPTAVRTPLACYSRGYPQHAGGVRTVRYFSPSAASLGT